MNNDHDAMLIASAVLVAGATVALAIAPVGSAKVFPGILLFVGLALFVMAGSRTFARWGKSFVQQARGDKGEPSS